MDNENADAQEDVVEQEEQTSDEQDSSQETEEETVTIPKQKFVKMQRKAQAYDATKGEPVKKVITSNSDAKWRERMELRVDGYDDQAIDFIQKNGGRKSLENPYIVKAIEAMSEQKKAEKATVDEGSKSPAEKRINPNDFSKLSSAEQLKALSDLK